MSILGPCTACRRHVRVDASSCPFCGEALGPFERAAGSGFVRMSRAAMLAGAVAAAGGCHSPPASVYGGPPTPEPTLTDAAAPAASESSVASPPAAIYGGPPTPAEPAPSVVPK